MKALLFEKFRGYGFAILLASAFNLALYAIDKVMHLFGGCLGM